MNKNDITHRDLPALLSFVQPPQCPMILDKNNPGTTTTISNSTTICNSCASKTRRKQLTQ
jgi:hypothetical protein